MTKSATSDHHHLNEEETRGRSGYYDFHAPRPLTHDKRVSSYPSTIASSTISTTSSTSKRVASWLKGPTAKSTTAPPNYKPKVNVHTTCGRHTDQLLFSGPSLTDLARSVFKKNK